MPVRKSSRKPKSSSSSRSHSSSSKRKAASTRSKHRNPSRSSRPSYSSSLTWFGSGQRRRIFGLHGRRTPYPPTYTPAMMYSGPYGGQYDQATYPPGEARSRTMRLGWIGGMIIVAVIALLIFAAVIAFSL